MERIFGKLNRYFRGNFCLAVLDDAAGRWPVKPWPGNIAYLKAENANGRHILLQPFAAAQPFYLLADDITPRLLNRHHKNRDGSWKPGRMIVETSPGNFQVWIHSSRFLRLEEKRYWLKRLRSDPGASPKDRWGRCPGFRNRKTKHRDSEGRYPLSRLIWIDWKNEVFVPSLSHQPVGGVCRKNHLSRADYERGDESATDFAYAVALSRRGYSNDEIYKRLLNERSSWMNHMGSKKKWSYLCRTIDGAKRIVENS